MGKRRCGSDVNHSNRFSNMRIPMRNHDHAHDVALGAHRHHRPPQVVLAAGGNSLEGSAEVEARGGGGEVAGCGGGPLLTCPTRHALPAPAHLRRGGEARRGSEARTVEGQAGKEGGRGSEARTVEGQAGKEGGRAGGHWTQRGARE
eukprot:1188497-Prorocentrum_minimum.AAC.2